MKLCKLPYELTVCKLSSVDDIDLGLDFLFIGKTDKEISLVCRTEEVPSPATEREEAGYTII